MESWRTVTVLAVLSACLLFAPGCASEQHDTDYYDESSTNIERPARPIDEEETLSDKVGEVGVVLLVIGSVAAGIVLPFLLF